jgi:hypothetical protein
VILETLRSLQCPQGGCVARSPFGVIAHPAGRRRTLARWMDSAASKPSDDAIRAGGDVTDGAKPALQPSQTPPPPYWQHKRSISHLSQISLDRPRPITLRDRTGSLSSTSGALWAKSISIEDYVIVSGNVTGIGAYVVWTCKVQTLDVSLFIRDRATTTAFY